MTIELEEDLQALGGFNAVFDETTETTETPVEEVVVGAEEPVVAETPKYAQLTEAQYQELLAKAGELDSFKADYRKGLDTASGHIGAIRQQLSAIQSSGTLEVSEEDFADLREIYPEVAALTASGLNKALAKLRAPATASPAIDPEHINQIVNQRLATETEKLTRSMEERFLASQHRDWKAVAKSEEFKSWSETLPEAERNQLWESYDSDFLSEKISAYKETDAYKETKAPVVKTDPKADAKTRLIQAAITPTGTRAAQPSTNSEADAFNSVFKGG